MKIASPESQGGNRARFAEAGASYSSTARTSFFLDAALKKSCVVVLFHVVDIAAVVVVVSQSLTILLN